MTGSAGNNPPQMKEPAQPAGVGAASAEALADGRVSAGSSFFQRLQRRYEAQLPLLPAGAPDLGLMAAAFAALRAQGIEAGAALRILRQLVMHRLIVLDCDAQQALDVITRSITELAEFALN